jgi:hypothetical protein
VCGVTCVSIKVVRSPHVTHLFEPYHARAVHFEGLLHTANSPDFHRLWAHARAREVEADCLGAEGAFRTAGAPHSLLQNQLLRF